jgi:hypothetical protein
VQYHTVILRSKTPSKWARLMVVIFDLLRRIITRSETKTVHSPRCTRTATILSTVPSGPSPQTYMSFIITGSYIVRALIALDQKQLMERRNCFITIHFSRYEAKLDLSGPEIRGAVHGCHLQKKIKTSKVYLRCCSWDESRMLTGVLYNKRKG